jgi:hypothetical protein
MLVSATVPFLFTGYSARRHGGGKDGDMCGLK